MQITGFGLTDVGRVRSSNEDSLGVFPDLGLYLVADGMGGHAAGEVASRLAVETVQEYLAGAGSEEDTLPFELPPDLAVTARLVTAAAKFANLRIHEAARADTAKSGMGTTLVMALRDRDAADSVYIGHVGDSRAYLVRDGQARQLTQDHSLINDYISQGLLSEEEANQHPLKHVITRALGSARQVDVDLQRLTLKPGDTIVLCSDGLSNLVGESEIAEAIRTDDLKAACRRLVDLALKKGGDDNVTVVLLRSVPD
jgi:protein phosphatase